MRGVVWLCRARCGGGVAEGDAEVTGSARFGRLSWAAGGPGETADKGLRRGNGGWLPRRTSGVVYSQPAPAGFHIAVIQCTYELLVNNDGFDCSHTPEGSIGGGFPVQGVVLSYSGMLVCCYGFVVIACFDNNGVLVPGCPADVGYGLCF